MRARNDDQTYVRPTSDLRFFADRRSKLPKGKTNTYGPHETYGKSYGRPTQCRPMAPRRWGGGQGHTTTIRTPASHRGETYGRHSRCA